jgi:hypothetical protein
MYGVWPRKTQNKGKNKISFLAQTVREGPSGLWQQKGLFRGFTECMELG